MTLTRRDPRAGLVIALVSAAAFGIAGPLGKSLLETGWSPLAVVLARLAGAVAVTLPILVVVVARGWRPAPGQLRTTVLYGVAAMAGAQVCFYNAVNHLPVGVALLLEYLAPVLLLGWAWARTGRAPTGRTIQGAVLAMVGLALVLDVAGDASVDVVGVLWGLAAAVCLGVYFQVAAGEGAPPAIVLTAGGMVVGALTVLTVGLASELLASNPALPLQAATADATLGGLVLPWWVVAIGLSLVATVLAYGTGIVAIGILGTKVASFIGLSEVLFAVLTAWWLVAETPSLPQAIGGVLVIAGITVVRLADRSGQPGAPAPSPPSGRRRTKASLPSR